MSNGGGRGGSNFYGPDFQQGDEDLADKLTDLIFNFSAPHRFAKNQVLFFSFF